MTTKITVSLPDHLVEQARSAVATGLAASVSGYVASALEAMPAPPYSLEQFMAEMDEEFGPVPDEVKAWADAELERVAREWEAIRGEA